MFKEPSNSFEARDGLKSKATIIGELSFVGDHSGNQLKFKDIGKIINGQDQKIVNSKIIEGLDNEHLEIFSEALQGLRNFLEFPIFTDDFHADNESRRGWEKNNLTNISPEAREYYSSNRLSTNVYSSAIAYLNSLEELPFNSDVKEELRGLSLEVPPILLELDREGILVYHRLSDDEKISVIKELTRVIEKAINLLEKNS